MAKKTLTDFAWDRTCVARRHRDLLVSEPLVVQPALRGLQVEYRLADEELVRRIVAVAFDRAVCGGGQAGRRDCQSSIE